MASTEQIAANRTNSSKSTGPCTETGKRAAAGNALKWGVFSAQVLLPDEDGGLFQEFARQTLAGLQPAGALETMLADAIVASLWRWRRLHAVESGLLQMYRVYEGQDRGVATAFAHDASQMDCLGRLARYETALERRFLRLLHELQRLQAARAGQNVPPPAVVDVAVDVHGAQLDSAT